MKHLSLSLSLSLCSFYVLKEFILNVDFVILIPNYITDYINQL
jgi:hypothetical protein